MFQQELTDKTVPSLYDTIPMELYANVNTKFPVFRVDLLLLYDKHTPQPEIHNLLFHTESWLQHTSTTNLKMTYNACLLSMQL